MPKTAVAFIFYGYCQLPTWLQALQHRAVFAEEAVSSGHGAVGKE